MTRQAWQALAAFDLPDSAVVRQAIDEAHERCETYLFNHVMRSWLFAAKFAQLNRLAHDAEVVAIGTVLHDVTLNESFDGPRRFEVEAADIARDFALEAGFAANRAALVWDSVALNATPSIGLHKEPEVMLCTTGICLDVVGLRYDALPQADIETVVRAFPRLAMKRRMSACFCHMAATRPETTYDNFVRDFGERHVPGYRAPSAVDAVNAAPFDE